MSATRAQCKVKCEVELSLLGKCWKPLSFIDLHRQGNVMNAFPARQRLIHNDAVGFVCCFSSQDFSYWEVRSPVFKLIVEYIVDPPTITRQKMITVHIEMLDTPSREMPAWTW